MRWGKNVDLQAYTRTFVPAIDCCWTDVNNLSYEDPLLKLTIRATTYFPLSYYFYDNNFKPSVDGLVESSY